MRGSTGRRGKGSGGEGSGSKRQKIGGEAGFWDWDHNPSLLQGREASWAEGPSSSNLTGSGLREAHSPLGFSCGALCTS